MMSIVKLTPGTVGDYLTRHVAALDSTELGRTKLADYYQVAGESPGRWMGSGLTGLGMKPGDEVTAEQMKYLFEQARHPLSDLLIEALGPDASDRDKARAIRLGQKFPEFEKATPFQLELARRYDEATRGRSLSATDGRNLRARLRSEVGAVAALKQVDIVPALPKTRSGKILRKTMREIADGKVPSVPGTIEDASVLDLLADTLKNTHH